MRRKVVVDQTKDGLRGPLRSIRLPWRAVLFLVLLAAYVALTLGVIHRSPLLTMDRDVVRLHLRERWPEWFPGIHTYVMLGQRGPSTLVALPWFVWLAWKSRSSRPLVMLGTALLVLNLSVGVVKVAVGRLGPLRTRRPHAVFEGGNIFPSGHVSNAVVLYGVIAILALGYRKTAATLAVVIALTVGLSTIYLDTHWFTDVLGGWLAGGLVLLVLPALTPYAERCVAAVARRLVRVWHGVRKQPQTAPGLLRRPARTPPIDITPAIDGMPGQRASGSVAVSQTGVARAEA
jgi:membrane-associated phospholipid phosphatase